VAFEIKVPEIGESITEGTITAWLVEHEAFVEADDPLFELETDKINLEVPAPVAGQVAIEVPAGTEVAIGQRVGTIDTDAVRSEPVQEGPPARETEASGEPEPAVITPRAGMAQARAKMDAAGGDVTLSPAVRNMVAEHGLDVSRIEGTGPKGRITKGDVVGIMDKPSAGKQEAGGARETRRKMSPIRQRIAERLTQVQHSAAILTTFNEVDMSFVVALRERVKVPFAQKFGVKLGFMSFFVKAAVEALKAVPQLNARIEGDEIVTNHYYDIGIAVGTDRGLVVPVVRNCDKLSFAEIEHMIADYAKRAQDKTLKLEDLMGGVFTISNGGIYGSMLSTPILNPPQSGILGMHAIKKRPVAVDDRIEIRPMMYLALSYDHRIVDGKDAVTFLKQIVDCLETPERLMLEVCDGNL
jgi:2-oxoglutarate dehydrogenase E2 component (dihydrolipoamide succinyltransferase)